MDHGLLCLCRTMEAVIVIMRPGTGHDNNKSCQTSLSLSFSDNDLVTTGDPGPLLVTTRHCNKIIDFCFQPSGLVLVSSV